MLCVVTEETERIIGERRLRVLRDLGARIGDTRTSDEVWGAVGACLASEAHDLPFGLAYLGDDEGQLRPAIRAGLARDGAALDAMALIPADEWSLEPVPRRSLRRVH